MLSATDKSSEFSFTALWIFANIESRQTGLKHTVYWKQHACMTCSFVLKIQGPPMACLLVFRKLNHYLHRASHLVVYFKFIDNLFFVGVFYITYWWFVVFCERRAPQASAEGLVQVIHRPPVKDDGSKCGWLGSRNIHIFLVVGCFRGRCSRIVFRLFPVVSR